MRRIDWQSYDDGSITPEQRQHALDALREDDASLRELAGLKAFQKTLRQAALKDPIPTESLEARLRAVTGQGQSKQRLLAWSLGSAAACACIFATVLFFQPQPVAPAFASSPELTVKETHNPYEAASWASQKSGINVPVITLAGVRNEFERARCGSCWVAFDYLVDGEMYTIFAKKSWHSFDRINKTEMRNGREFYMGSDGIGWYCHAGMSYYVVGGDEAGRWRVALAACQETPNIGI